MKRLHLHQDERRVVKDATGHSHSALERQTPKGTARLVLEMNCTTCGPIRHLVNPLSIPELALRHAESTGHVVILNGTADLLTDTEAPEFDCLDFIEANVR